MEVILAVIGLISLASLGAILLFISPPQITGQESYLAPVLLSVSLFLALASLLTFLGNWARRKFITEKNRGIILKISFREGVLLSFLVAIYMWLSRFKILNIFVAIVILGLTLAAEYYFLTRNAKLRQT